VTYCTGGQIVAVGEVDNKRYRLSGKRHYHAPEADVCTEKVLESGQSGPALDAGGKGINA